jgi:hypothetical protein
MLTDKQKVIIVKIVFASVFFILSIICNEHYYGATPFFSDWIWGTYTVGDIFHIIALSFIFSIFIRGGTSGETKQKNKGKDEKKKVCAV